jgi:hypothetical protein
MDHIKSIFDTLQLKNNSDNIYYDIDYILDYKNTINIFGCIETMGDWYELSVDKYNCVANISSYTLWVCIGYTIHNLYIFLQINNKHQNYKKIKYVDNINNREYFI